MHYNNTIINNNYGSLRELILPFKIPIGTRKDFIELYRLFGQAPSNRFANPAADRTSVYLSN